MNASTEKRSLAVCPFCGESYDAPPALSRIDNESLICPDCGTREALTSIGTPPEEQEKILAIIHEHVGRISKEGRQEKRMYKVVYEYADGGKGTCKEDGKVKLFNTKQEAAAYASDLNNRIEENMKPFLPTYRAVEA